MKTTIHPAPLIQARIPLPGDKSLSHSALILAAMAKGNSEIHSLLHSEDIRATRRCLQALGVSITQMGNRTCIQGKGRRGLQEPASTLDCGNSGTTLRLLVGLLAGQDFSATLTGDDSLRRRPMQSFALPLRHMGAQIELEQDQWAPVRLQGQPLKGIAYELPVASAQLKGALLLAGTQAEGKTVLSGQLASRDHMERLLQHFGGKLTLTPLDPGEPLAGQISLNGSQELRPTRLAIPGDPSSAAFWMAGACLLKGSWVEFDSISLNPTRMGFVEALKRMGIPIRLKVAQAEPEPLGRLAAAYAPLQGITLTSDEIPSLLDELPLVAVLATQAQGITRVSGAGELRGQECDRLEAIAKNLQAMGVEIDLQPDGFVLEGPQPLKGAQLDACGDHRIAMAFAIAALAAKGPSQILGSECVAASYPDFFQQLACYTQVLQ